jgi:hypothetical protein
MFDDKAKMFLIKAMTEGIDCYFPDVAAIDRYIETLREIIDQNQKIESVIIGDSDGLIIESISTNEGPYASIIFSSELVTFGLLVPESDMSERQSLDFSRIVLACISACAIIDSKINSTKKVNRNDQSVKFNISEIGIIV